MKDGALNLTNGRSKNANAARESDLNSKRKVGKSQRASYTPNAAINPLSYGKDGGKIDPLGSPAGVVVDGASVAQAPPAMPGTLKIGQDKNVSTPVSG